MSAVQPLQGYLASANPDLEAKTADIIDLYLHAPQHTAAFCVDEKTAIQAPRTGSYPAGRARNWAMLLRSECCCWVSKISLPVAMTAWMLTV